MTASAPKVALNAGLLVLGWLLVWVGQFYMVPNLHVPLLIGLADPAVHGLVSLLLVLPLVLLHQLDIRVAVITVLVGVLIDLDHAVAAGSFDFKAMLSLPGRPVGHSLLVAGLVAGTLGLALRWHDGRYANWGPFYLFFASLVSHIARDGVTPWAFPFTASPIPKEVFFGIFIPLTGLHLLYGARSAKIGVADSASNI
jgi:hypothetical protein